MPPLTHLNHPPRPGTTDTHAMGIFWVFLRLGLTSFGGPVAHLGFFRHEFVARRRWLSEQAYADLVALCQFLPGPASSQVGMALGLGRAGYPGAFAAWLGFTLPSAVLLGVLGAGLGSLPLSHPALVGALHGLKVAAVAVVAHAVWGMQRSLCPGTRHRVLMAAAAVLASALPFTLTPVVLVIGGAVAGLAWLRSEPSPSSDTAAPPAPAHTPTRRAGAVWLAAFALGLLVLPALATLSSTWAVFDAFYRAGALVFGGGHVVLPLLQAEVVPTGWVNADTFLTGYAAAQAVPGPLFTLAAFLGAAMPGVVPPVAGATVALVGVFAPSFLLVAGALPFWARLRQHPSARAALAGTNAVVVGLLLAALLHPVATSALWPSAAGGWAATLPAWGLALSATAALMRQWLPAWALVLLCGALGALGTVSFGAGLGS